jgi:hypothetical protein
VRDGEAEIVAGAWHFEASARSGIERFYGSICFFTSVRYRTLAPRYFK